jgi:hypothetical protein
MLVGNEASGLGWVARVQSGRVWGVEVSAEVGWLSRCRALAFLSGSFCFQSTGLAGRTWHALLSVWSEAIVRDATLLCTCPILVQNLPEGYPVKTAYSTSILYVENVLVNFSVDLGVVRSRLVQHPQVDSHRSKTTPSVSSARLTA